MSRLGKIARLPRALREELNHRLADGEPGSAILPWVNAHPDALPVLERYFQSRRISEQNLTEWRQGGYLEWERQLETRDWMRGIVEKSTGLQEDAGNGSMADRLSASLAVALARCVDNIAPDVHNDPSQWRTLKLVAQELAHLRRGDHAEQRLRLQRERWEAHQEKTKLRQIDPGPRDRSAQIAALAEAVNSCSRLLAAQVSHENKIADALLADATAAAAASDTKSASNVP